MIFWDICLPEMNVHVTLKHVAMNKAPYKKDRQTRWIKAGILLLIAWILLLFRPGAHSPSPSVYKTPHGNEYSAASPTVYKTPHGKKYHTADCHTVRNVSEQLTVTAAESLGLEPCKICHPESAKLLSQPVNKAVGTGTTVRCQGTTKRGTRCKHMTSIANGYCFQHQPHE